MQKIGRVNMPKCSQHCMLLKRRRKTWKKWKLNRSLDNFWLVWLYGRSLSLFVLKVYPKLKNKNIVLRSNLQRTFIYKDYVSNAIVV